MNFNITRVHKSNVLRFSTLNIMHQTKPCSCNLGPLSKPKPHHVHVCFLKQNKVSVVKNNNQLPKKRKERIITSWQQWK